MRELQRKLVEDRVPRPVPPPPRTKKSPPAPAVKRASESTITFVRPARLFPLVPAALRYPSVALGWLRKWLVPFVRVPALPSSDILVLDLLRLLVTAAWVPVSLLGRVVIFLVSALWFVVLAPVIAVGIAAMSACLLPAILVLSVRRARPGKTLVGLKWGTTTSDEDVQSLVLAALMLMVGWAVFLPLLLL